MKRCLAIAVCSGVAWTARGVNFMNLELQWRFPGEVGWYTGDAELYFGHSLEIRMVARWGRSGGLPDVAWGSLSLSQIGVFAYPEGAADTITNVHGLISPSGQTFKLLDPGTPKGRLDRSDDLSPGADIQLAQPPIDSGGDPTRPLEIFAFTYNVLGSGFGEYVRLATGAMKSGTIYTSASGEFSSVPVANMHGGEMTIWIQGPAPGTGAPVVVFLLGSARRRRVG